MNVHRAGIAFFALWTAQAWACTCLTPATPSAAAGRAAAVFMGTVIRITDPEFNPPARMDAGLTAAARRGDASREPRLPRPLRVIRLLVGEALSGISPEQREIEVVTGMGGGDCGIAFETGKEFFVYAAKDAEGRLLSHLCSRTRPLAAAGEDLAYLRSRTGTPEASQIVVRTSYGRYTAPPNMQIAIDGPGGRRFATTNSGGQATFDGLPAGSYRIHAVADGDLEDDPEIDLGAHGSQEVTLFQASTIRGSVKPNDWSGAAMEIRGPSGRVHSFAVRADGTFALTLRQPGPHRLGVRLGDGRGRWFHPGTENESAATIIDLPMDPGAKTYDLVLPLIRNP